MAPGSHVPHGNKTTPRRGANKLKTEETHGVAETQKSSDLPNHPLAPMRRVGAQHPALQVIKKEKMGRSRYIITDSNAPHFLTFTILNWLAIFTRPETVQIILDALVWRQNHKNIKVYGYVILENHMHCILQSPDLGQQVHDFKAFTAKEILRHLEQNQAHNLLEQLSFFKKSHKTNANYQLWEEGSHPQLIQNEEMLRQKIDYIHLNPVNRGYVDEAVHWRYSSARNYHGHEGLIPIYTEW